MGPHSRVEAVPKMISEKIGPKITIFGPIKVDCFCDPKTFVFSFQRPSVKDGLIFFSFLSVLPPDYLPDSVGLSVSFLLLSFFVFFPVKAPIRVAGIDHSSYNFTTPALS